MHIIGKIRMLLNLSERTKNEIMMKGYGKPIALLKRGGGRFHGYLGDFPGEHIPRFYSYYETVYLTDKGNRVVVAEKSSSSGESSPCDYYEQNIYLEDN